jgi:hypothetical protein
VFALALLGACGEPPGEEQTGPSGQVSAASPTDAGETANTEEGLIDLRDAGTPGAALIRDPIAALPPTELALTLLATQKAADPADAAATIRNDDTGVIRQYRVGDPLAEDATLAAVSIAAVQIQRPGDSESLAIRRESIELRDGDVYYPDLVEPDDFVGVLTQGLQLPPGLHYAVKRPDNAFGTPRTIRAIQESVRAYRQKVEGGPQIHVGDISRRGGGHFPPHLSHRHGRDVDVGYVLSGEEADDLRFRHAGAHNLDVARSWALLAAFLGAGEAHYVFLDYGLQRLLYEQAVREGVSAERLAEVFQYPRGRHAPHGIVRHWRGHSNHFHVRFRE